MDNPDDQPGRREDIAATAALATARLLADFVDALVPGDDHWPSASQVGVQAVLASRIVDVDGEEAVDRLAGLVRAAGGFDGKNEAERSATVASLERDHGELFTLLRNAVYLAYYENPAVAARIRSLGFTYKLRPHIGGYATLPVDPVRDRPRHQRGFYTRTEDVRRLDLSRLAGVPEAKREGANGDG
jgi:hypothetical protein